MRRQNLTFQEFRNQYYLDGMCGIALIIMAVTLLITWRIYAVDYQHQQEVKKFYHEIVTVYPLEIQTPTRGKIIYTPDEEKIRFVLGTIMALAQNNPEILDQIDNYKKDFGAVFISTSPLPTELPIDVSRQVLFLSYMRIGGLIGYGINILIAIILYGLITQDYGGYIIDLPWQKPWVWIFVIFTAPCCAPCFAVSGFKYWRELRTHDTQQTTSSQEKLKRAQLAITENVTTARALLAGEARKYRAQYAQSNKLWLEARLDAYGIWERRTQDLRDRIEQSRETLINLGKSIQSTQETLRNDTQSLQHLERTAPENFITETDKQRIYAEFDRVCMLPEVLAAHIDSEKIQVFTKPIIIRGHDTGNYTIEIAYFMHPDPRYPQLRILNRVSTLPFEKRQTLYGVDGSFCFGDRAPMIEEKLEQREFLPVIALVLESLRTLNPEHEDKLRIYPKV